MLQLEVVYREALRVIINRVGAPSTVATSENKEMYALLQRAYNVDDTTHQNFVAKELSAEVWIYCVCSNTRG